MDRDLADAVGETHGEFAAGVKGTCENIHDRVGAFCARHPYLKDGLGFTGKFSDVQGSSGEEDDGNVLVDLVNFVEEGLLDLGDLYVCIAGGLAGLDVVLA